MSAYKMTDEDRQRVVKWLGFDSIEEVTQDRWPFNYEWTVDHDGRHEHAIMPDFPRSDGYSVRLIQLIGHENGLNLELIPYSWGWRCTIVTDSTRESIADSSSLGETALRVLEALS